MEADLIQRMELLRKENKDFLQQLIRAQKEAAKSQSRMVIAEEELALEQEKGIEARARVTHENRLLMDSVASKEGEIKSLQKEVQKEREKVAAALAVGERHKNRVSLLEQEVEKRKASWAATVVRQEEEILRLQDSMLEERSTAEKEIQGLRKTSTLRGEEMARLHAAQDEFKSRIELMKEEHRAKELVWRKDGLAKEIELRREVTAHKEEICDLKDQLNVSTAVQGVLDVQLKTTTADNRMDITRVRLASTEESMRHNIEAQQAQALVLLYSEQRKADREHTKRLQEHARELLNTKEEYLSKEKHEIEERARKTVETWSLAQQKLLEGLNTEAVERKEAYMGLTNKLEDDIRNQQRRTGEVSLQVETVRTEYENKVAELLHAESWKAEVKAAEHEKLVLELSNEVARLKQLMEIAKTESDQRSAHEASVRAELEQQIETAKEAKRKELLNVHTVHKSQFSHQENEFQMQVRVAREDQKSSRREVMLARERIVAMNDELTEAKLEIKRLASCGAANSSLESRIDALTKSNSELQLKLDQANGEWQRKFQTFEAEQSDTYAQKASDDLLHLDRERLTMNETSLRQQMVTDEVTSRCNLISDHAFTARAVMKVVEAEVLCRCTELEQTVHEKVSLAEAQNDIKAERSAAEVFFHKAATKNLQEEVKYLREEIENVRNESDERLSRIVARHEQELTNVHSTYGARMKHVSDDRDTLAMDLKSKLDALTAKVQQYQTEAQSAEDEKEALKELVAKEAHTLDMRFNEERDALQLASQKSLQEAAQKQRELLESQRNTMNEQIQALVRDKEEAENTVRALTADLLVVQHTNERLHEEYKARLRKQMEEYETRLAAASPARNPPSALSTPPSTSGISGSGAPPGLGLGLSTLPPSPLSSLGMSASTAFSPSPLRSAWDGTLGNSSGGAPGPDGARSPATHHAPTPLRPEKKEGSPQGVAGPRPKDKGEEGDPEEEGSDGGSPIL